MVRLSHVMPLGAFALLWSATSMTAGAAEGKMCGGIAAIKCESGLYCDYGARCGVTDQSGRCRKKPKVCPQSDLASHFCGCDGHGYTTKCAAAKAGVSIKSNGPCPSSGGGAAEGKMCGGIAAIKCQAGLYCEYGASCGATDQSGTCKKKPTVCPQSDLASHFCGCDGHGYTTKCAAAKAGVSIKSNGPCGGKVGEACGSRGLQPCASGLYCQFASGCGADDRGGKCAEKPQACTMQYDPVCGCDGKTYSNACMAANSGVSVKSKGACPR